jgi:hypothetical protein
MVIEESADRDDAVTLEGSIEGETKASVTDANARIAQAVPETWLIILSESANQPSCVR